MKRILLLLIALCTLTPLVAKQPRLVVQIVVGSMRAGDLERYSANFTEGGFRLLMERGAYYPTAAYDFQQTISPVTLSTLATGAMPSMHGVIGDRWWDYTTGMPVDLTDGRRGAGGYNLVVPTLAETLKHHHPKAHAVSLALDATSAIVMGGKEGEVYWIDAAECEWASSLYYLSSTPEWIARSNREGYNLSYLLPDWRQLLDKKAYLNTRHNDIRLSIEGKRSTPNLKPRRIDVPLSDYITRMRHTPAGNSVVLGFAKQAIANFELGKDEVPDLLNITLDASRYIHRTYGPESIEVEDMYYRLDKDLADFLTFLHAQVPAEECVVVLTSDHGTSASYDLNEESPADRFNVQQFRVIINGFLNVRYGQGSWVLGYRERAIYLNHNLIYERNLNLEEVQNEVAIFAMQFSGVSHAQAATALRSSYFGSGYAQRMQQSFYPRRSGDVLLNLEPGLIEEVDGVYSASGSMYGYDRHVPLILHGDHIGARTIRREASMTDVAPTLARLMGIPAPGAAEGETLTEIVD